MDTSKVLSVIREELAPVLSGCLAFGATLGLSTCAQKMVGISTGTKTLARIAGIPTVCIASLLSQRCTLLAQEWTRNPEIVRDRKAFWRIVTKPYSNKEYYEISERFRLPKDDVHICLAGMASFKLLGGRFWAIAPSSYTAPGSFAYARDSLPATEKFATASQSAELGKIFKRRGCHTCGTRTSETVIGDHMPPRSIGALQKNPQYRFYAQCKPCSSQQGGILANATRQSQGWGKRKQARFLHASGGGSASYNHGAQFRINHLSGGVCGSITTFGGIDGDTPKKFGRKTAKSLRQTIWPIKGATALFKCQ